MERMAECGSGMGVVLEAALRAEPSRVLSSGNKGSQEDLQRDCEGGRNQADEYHGNQRKINPQEGEVPD